MGTRSVHSTHYYSAPRRTAHTAPRTAELPSCLLRVTKSLCAVLRAVKVAGFLRPRGGTPRFLIVFWLTSRHYYLFLNMIRLLVYNALARPCVRTVCMNVFLHPARSGTPTPSRVLKHSQSACTYSIILRRVTAATCNRCDV